MARERCCSGVPVLRLPPGPNSGASLDMDDVHVVKVVTAEQRRRAARRNAVSLISPMPPPASRKRARDEETYSTPGGKRQRAVRSHNGANRAVSSDFGASPRRVFASGTYKDVFRARYVVNVVRLQSACSNTRLPNQVQRWWRSPRRGVRVQGIQG